MQLIWRCTGSYIHYKQGPGGKPSKRRFGGLFTTKELYGVVHAGNSEEHCRHICITNHHLYQYMYMLCILVRLQYQRPHQYKARLDVGNCLANKARASCGNIFLALLLTSCIYGPFNSDIRINVHVICYMFHW